MKARAFSWLLGACFSLCWAASCSSSDGKQQAQNPGGEGGEAAAGSAGQGTMSGGTGASVSALGGAGGDAAGAAMSAGAAGDASVGGAAGADLGGAATGGGGSLEGGAGGQGGAPVDACCNPLVDYNAEGSVLPTDVTCGAWQLVNTADVEMPLFSAGALRVATSVNSELMYYSQPAANLAFPTVLTIEARMKLVTGSSATPSRAPAVLGFVYGATHQKNLLQMAANEVFLLQSENAKGPSIVFDTIAAFHTYKLVVDTQLGSIQVFIDDQLKLTGSVFVDPSASDNYITFGQGSTYSNGSSDWLFVKHNAYACAE